MAKLHGRREIMALIAGGTACAGDLPTYSASLISDRNFITSDGTRLHYLETGKGPKTIVFVPGWTMPAWIWMAQLIFLSTYCRAVALDPRGQGQSAIATTGYTYDRRGRDIGELLVHLRPGSTILVGWSLGVLDALAYLHQAGAGQIAGLVLVDNSVGVGPPPRPRIGPAPGTGPSREAEMANFVRSLFRTRQSRVFLDHLTADALRTPPAASQALLNYSVPRTFWRDTVYSLHSPLLYIIRPGLQPQAEILLQDRPKTEVALFREAGHALFVDEPNRFNKVLHDFILQRIWPS